MKIIPIFNYISKDLYELAQKMGDKRFGSECKHKHTKKGRCTECLRRVVTK